MSATENRLFYFFPINHSPFSISASTAGGAVSKLTGANTTRCTNGVKMICDGRAQMNVAKRRSPSLICLIHASGALIVTSRTQQCTVLKIVSVKISCFVMWGTTIS